MKKNYLLMIALSLGFAINLNAQMQQSHSDFGVDTLWFEDFEGGELPNDWEIIQTNTNDDISLQGYQIDVAAYFSINQAQLGGTPPDGLAPLDAWHAGLWFDNSHQDEWLITSAFDCPEDAWFNFMAVARERDDNGDHYYVKASVDGGETWTVLWDAATLGGGDAMGMNNYQYPYHVDLSAYAGQNIKLAFHAIDSGNGLESVFFVDNISVTFTNANGLSGCMIFENTIYPNPAQDVVCVSSDKVIEQITVFNVNGQVVKTVNVVNKDFIIFSTETFSEGVYFVEIKNIDGDIEQIKLMLVR